MLELIIQQTNSTVTTTVLQQQSGQSLLGSPIDSIILVLLLGSAATYLLDPYAKNAPVEWYTERVLFSLRNGVTLLGLLLASIAFVSGNLATRGQKVIGANFLATTLLLSIALIFGYMVIRRPQPAANSKFIRILGSVCIAFVNVSTVYVAILVLGFILFYFYGLGG